MSTQPNPVGPVSQRWKPATFGLSAVALAGFIAAWATLHGRTINVVNHESTGLTAPARVGTYIAPLVAIACLAGAAFAAAPSARAWPAVGLGVLGGVGLVADADGFFYASAVAMCAGWAADRAAPGAAWPRLRPWIDRFAPAILGVSIVSSTVWHAAEQFNFWQHFSLGYADFGFFITELEHCLPWKDVTDRFADTRMGYHCIPLFYLLAPFYALVRTPVFLMVAGPLALNLAGVAFYQLGRHRGVSPAAALLIGVGWLLLPSLSRLPYANTYGFQSIYLAVPWLAFAWSFALRDRWGASHVCLAAAMLCEETVCGVAFGWGLYLALCTPRRRAGIIIAAGALVYLALCITLVIPCFAESAAYTRLKLFGEWSGSTLLDRLFRPRVGLYLLVLFAPVALGISRSRAAFKLLLVAAPTLLLVVLMQNDDYLNIKYWHQASILPALYLAATVGLCARTKGSEGSKDRGINGISNLRFQISDEIPQSRTTAAALGLFVGILLFHQLLGFSPLAQSYRPYIADAAMQSPDPRMELMDWVRTRYPRETTTVLATQRMAAHFCKYRAVYPASYVLSGAWPEADLVVMDSSDTWDPLVRQRGLGWLREQASRAGFAPVLERGTVTVLRRSGR